MSKEIEELRDQIGRKLDIFILTWPETQLEPNNPLSSSPLSLSLSPLKVDFFSWLLIKDETTG